MSIPLVEALEQLSLPPGTYCCKVGGREVVVQVREAKPAEPRLLTDGDSFVYRMEPYSGPSFTCQMDPNGEPTFVYQMESRCEATFRPDPWPTFLGSLENFSLTHRAAPELPTPPQPLPSKETEKGTSDVPVILRLPDPYPGE